MSKKNLEQSSFSSSENRGRAIYVQFLSENLKSNRKNWKVMEIGIRKHFYFLSKFEGQI